MSLFAILFTGLALAMDSTAVSLAASTAGKITSKRAALRLSFHFGLFQGGMPVLGYLVGSTIEPMIADYDHWVAFFLLMFVAINMLREAFSDDDEEFRHQNPSKGRTMVMLSVATSIDALAVGLSLRMLHISIWIPSLLFGIVTMAVCLIAMKIGTRVGTWLDTQAQLVGSLVLMFIAVRIVFTHMAG